MAVHTCTTFLHGACISHLSHTSSWKTPPYTHCINSLKISSTHYHHPSLLHPRNNPHTIINTQSWSRYRGKVMKDLKFHMCTTIISSVHYNMNIIRSKARVELTLMLKYDISLLTPITKTWRIYTQSGYYLKKIHYHKNIKEIWFVGRLSILHVEVETIGLKSNLHSHMESFKRLCNGSALVGSSVSQMESFKRLCNGSALVGSPVQLGRIWWRWRWFGSWSWGRLAPHVLVCTQDPHKQQCRLYGCGFLAL